MSSDEESTNDEVPQIGNQEIQQSTYQHHEQSPNQQGVEPAIQDLSNLSLDLRNNLQLQNLQIGGDLMTFAGNVNVDHSNVNNFQNFEHVENLTFNITRNIVGPQQNIQVTNSRIDNNGTASNSAAASFIVFGVIGVIGVIFHFFLLDIEVFDEHRFMNYFDRMECRYKDIKSKERPITEDMYDNMPLAMETSFEQLSNRSREQITQEGTTKLSQAFPMEGERANKRMIAIIGEPGAGKSVYSITLKSYYIKQGFFVFSLNFLNMNFSNESNQMSFAELLINFACPDFLFDSPKTFEIWLFHNEVNCVFILDGLDQAPHLIKSNVNARNIQSAASIGIWMSALLGRKIMKRAKKIYTSRPTSVVNLAPSQQPDQIFSLNGFSDQSIEGVIKTYNNEHADQITQFIKNKGPDVIRFTRNPFIISLISLVYGSSSTHITNATTITEIYRIGLHQLSSSIRNLRDEDGGPNQNQQTEDLVDKFYYEVFLENKISFTEEDVIQRNLSVKDLEQFSLISITSNQFSLGVESKERKITPQHQSVSEYQVSRHLVKVMDIEGFKTVVEEQMFKLDDQDRWNMIRKFVAGLINTGEFDERKRKIFLSKFVTKLKEYVTGDVLVKCDGNRQTLRQAILFQSSLFNDIPEMNKEIDFLRTSFTGIPALQLDMVIKDASSLHGPIYFLRQIDPQLNMLDIRFFYDVTILQFNQFAEAIINLTKNVGYIAIHNIRLTHENMENFHGIIEKTVVKLKLQYDPEVNVDEIEMIKQNLQSQIDQFQSKTTFIVLNHQRHRQHLIRHSMYTSMTSSIVMQSPYGGATINLMLCRRRENFAQVENIANNHPNYQWVFVISQQDELKILGEFLIGVELRNVGKIDLYPTSDVNWDCIRMFCNTITQYPYKVSQLYLHNLLSSEIGINHVLNLLRNVQVGMFIFYMDEIDENEALRWQSELQSVQHRMPQHLQLFILFNNFLIERWPPSYTIQLTKKW